MTLCDDPRFNDALKSYFSTIRCLLATWRFSIAIMRSRTSFKEINPWDIIEALISRDHNSTAIWFFVSITPNSRLLHNFTVLERYSRESSPLRWLRFYVDYVVRVSLPLGSEYTNFIHPLTHIQWRQTGHGSHILCAPVLHLQCNKDYISIFE